MTAAENAHLQHIVANRSLHRYSQIPEPSSLYVARLFNSLLAKFQGIEIIVPDMYALITGWHFRVNPAYERMHEETDAWLLSWVKDPAMRKRIVAADFAKLAGCFYPEAEYEQYRTMAYYLGWVFVWDDEIDCGSLTHNEAETKLYRNRTIKYLTHRLGSASTLSKSPDTCDIVGAFGTIADRIRTSCSSDARARVLDGLLQYTNQVCQLQSDRKRFLPTIEKHLEDRRKTGGVAISIALIEYAYGLAIPKHIMKREAMQTIRLLANDLVTLINDMASFAKEFADEQLDNLIPLFVHHHDLSPQEAMDRTADLVRDRHAKFAAAEHHLLSSIDERELNQTVRRFIQGCKDIAAGNVHWSYETKRYFGSNPVRHGNQITLQL